MRITAFVSGNLAAETMSLVLRRIESLGQHELRTITDGFHPTIRLPGAEQIDFSSPTEIRKSLTGTNLLLTSIRSPGFNERVLLRCANELGVKSLVILADLGSGAQKFRDNEGLVLPTSIAVSDQFTWGLLQKQGIPGGILAKIGSPYLDQVPIKLAGRAASDAAPTRLALLSLPNISDFAMWGEPCLYTESQVVQDCISLVEHNRQALDIRLHPKEVSCGQQFTIPNGALVRIVDSTSEYPINDFILSKHAIISTYSTALLVGSLLGVKSISYQPTKHKAVREEFYEFIGLPLARGIEQLGKHVVSSNNLRVSANIQASLFNFGESINRLMRHINAMV